MTMAVVKTLTASVDWSSGDATQVAVDNTSNKGKITAQVASVASGVAITATNGTISGQVSVTVGQVATTVTCYVVLQWQYRQYLHLGRDRNLQFQHRVELDQ